MDRRSRPGGRGRALLGALVALALVLFVPVVFGPPASAGTHSGTRVGALTVVDAFLPQPASPDVAAIYLTVKNSGSRSDELVDVSSAVAESSMLMSENPDGTMGIMRALRIPAHGSASLVPGRDHLMLEEPYHTFFLGERVAVTLRFARAGTVTISVPVVPESRILEHG